MAYVDDGFVRPTAEEIASEAPAAPGTSVLSSTQVHQEMGGAYYSLSFFVDAAGTEYMAMANELVTNSNITWCDLYVTPRGQGPSQAPTYRINPVDKIDRVAIFNSGHDLIIVLVTHGRAIVAGQPRPISIEMARINGIFATTPDYVAERGGEGVTIVPTDPIPVGGGATPEQVQAIVEAALGATAANSLVKQITTGSVSVRTALREIDKQGLVYLMDPANYNDPNDHDHLAHKFQDEFYSYVANLVWAQLAKFGEQVGYKPPKG